MPLSADHALMIEAAAVAPLSRTQIEVTGEDGARFLHNMCTNDVLALSPGSGCEAFFTNVQGKILAHGFLFRGHDAIVFDTVSNVAQPLMAHLDRYIIRERVELHDRTGEWAELLLAGPRAAGLLADLLGEQPPGDRLAHVGVTLPLAGQPAGMRVWPRRVDWTGPGDFFLSVAVEHEPALRTMLIAAGAPVVSHDALEAARVERGTPCHGRDITDANLPQEVGRDRLAINFHKGCYLGQETVARIDALGHVNRHLVGVRSRGDLAVGDTFTADGKSVGQVTSAVFSPRLRSPLALAYVRRGHHEPGTRLATASGEEAEVVSLPVN